MIFEATYPVVKKALTTIQNILTGSELTKPEFTTIQLHVEEESVYFSYQGEKEFQLEYQIQLAGANPILEGDLQICFQDLMAVIKSFDKQAGTLLFERDGYELRIDDGVYEPEIIILPTDCEVKENFRLSPPDQSLIVPSKWLSERLEIARINVRNSFLPATSDVALFLEPNGIRLRSFNLTNLYESTYLCSHALPSCLFLMDKIASSRLARLMKSVKEKEIHLHWNEKELYLFTHDMSFHFSGETNTDLKTLFETLPIEGMAEKRKTYTLPISQLKAATKVERGQDVPFGLAIEWQEKGVTFQTIMEDSNEWVPTTQYPFKLIQRITSKWMTTAEVAVGIDENCHPLLLEHSTNETRDIFIIMPLEPKPLVVDTP